MLTKEFRKSGFDCNIVGLSRFPCYYVLLKISGHFWITFLFFALFPLSNTYPTLLMKVSLELSFSVNQSLALTDCIIRGVISRARATFVCLTHSDSQSGDRAVYPKSNFLTKLRGFYLPLGNIRNPGYFGCGTHRG